MSNWHPRPSGNDAESEYHREIFRQANTSLPLRSSSKVKVQRSTTGTFLRMRAAIPAAGAGPLQGFKLVSDGGDYYNCNTWDGVNLGATFVKVAKDPDLRCVLLSAGGGAYPPVLPAVTGSGQVKRGITYTYTYTPSYATTADGVGIVEYSRGTTGSDGSSATGSVTPFLGVGSLLYAHPATFAGPSTLVGVKWLAIGSFAWTDA